MPFIQKHAMRLGACCPDIVTTFLNPGVGRRVIRAATAVFAGLLLAACAGPIRHDVTVFHEWPSDLSEKSFVIARKPDQQDTLQYRTYERIVRDELLAAGFVESANPVLQVAFSYGANRRTVRYVESSPAFTPYLTLGQYRRWGGLGISGPLWWGGYSSSVREVDSFERVLELEMSDLRVQPPQRVYEADASSRGDEPSLAAALPLLMKAVLADFPGRSGVARSVDVTPPEDQGDADEGDEDSAPASAVPADDEVPPPGDAETAPGGVPRVR